MNSGGPLDYNTLAMLAQSKLTLEHLLYAAILILAVFLRFNGLGAVPLSEAEAQPAWAAYQVSQGEATALGDQPSYVVLTSSLFAFLPATDFLARFWPALFGSALVLLPFFLRDWLGPKAGLVLALGLALDPGLVAVSRLAGGPMIAISAALFAWLALRREQAVLAGVLGMLALAASSTVYVGAISAGAAWLLARRGADNQDLNTLRPPNVEWRKLAWAAGATLALGLTWLMQMPKGLISPFATLADMVSGRPDFGGAPLIYVPLALVAYGLPAMVFGRFGAARALQERNGLRSFFAWWAITALAVLVLYPGRQVLDLLWVLLPLWVLAAAEFARFLKRPVEEELAALGQAALILLLSAFMLLYLARLNNLQVGSAPFYEALLAIGVIPVLALVASFLIGSGWSRTAAMHGLAWSTGLLMLGLLVSGVWRFASPEARASSDLWIPGPAAGQAHLLAQTVADLSEMTDGEQTSVAIDRQSSSAALAWTLREYPAHDPASFEQPTIVVSGPDFGEPSGVIAYRGQSFDWYVNRNWIGDVPGNLIGWLLYRDSLELREPVILWARADIFPSAQDEVINNEETP